MSSSKVTIRGNKKIGTLKKEFNRKFPYLRLSVYFTSERRKKTKSPLDNNLTIDDIQAKRPKSKQGGTNNYSIHGRIIVGNLEKDLDKNYGLYAQVCYTESDGGRYYTSGETDKATLAKLNDMGKVLGWQKGKWT